MKQFYCRNHTKQCQRPTAAWYSNTS